MSVPDSNKAGKKNPAQSFSQHPTQDGPGNSSSSSPPVSAFAITQTSTAGAGTAPGSQEQRKPGRTAFVGPYRILCRLGEGGMGIVYKAEQLEPIKRIVALKVMRSDHSAAQVIARFEAERQALARMDHPHIARVLDAGTDKDGRPYFVMELVPGMPITRFCDEQQLSITVRLNLFLQVCDAITHAHTKAILHRDIKSSNVLAYFADGEAETKVIDFGIAKALGGDRLSTRLDRTLEGRIIGTPESMSPEQAGGEADIDTRTDVYALGALLYEMLCGCPPLAHAMTPGIADFEIPRIVREVQPPRPSDRLTRDDSRVGEAAEKRGSTPAELVKKLRSELEWIPLMALRKERERRYASVAALAQDITNYLEHRPLLAGPDSRRYRAGKFLRRNKGPIAAAAAVLLTLVLGIVGTSVGFAREARQRALAEQRRVEADRQKAEALRQTEIAKANEQRAIKEQATAKATRDFFTRDILGKASPENTKDENVRKVLVDALIMPTARTINHQFKDAPEVRAAVQYSLSQTLLNLGRPELAEPLAKASWETRKTLFGAGNTDTLWSLNNYMMDVNAQGRHSEAAQLIRSAPEVFETKPYDDDETTLGMLGNFASVLNGGGYHSDAELLFKRIWDAWRRSKGNNHRGTLWKLSDYIGALVPQGKHSEAAALYKQLWQGRCVALGATDPLTIWALRQSAIETDQSGKSEDAIPLFRQIWEGRQKQLGEEHPDTLLALFEYAIQVGKCRHYAQAESLYKQCWDSRRRVLGDEYPDTLGTLNNYALAINSQGRHDEAASLMKQVWETRSRVLGPDNFDTLSNKENYAMIVGQAGRLPEAEMLFKEIWESKRRVKGDNADSLRVLNDYTMAITAQGRYADAEPLQRLAVERYRNSAPDDADRGYALHELSLTLAAEQKWADAELIARENLAFDQAHPKTGYWGRGQSRKELNRALQAQHKAEDADSSTTKP